MKTNTNLSLMAGTLALAVAGFFSVSSAALADGKGASQLMPAKVSKAGGTSQTAVSGYKSLMACSKCQDRFITVREITHKGSNLVSLKTRATHLCPTCETKILSVGQGKAKTDKVVHNCKGSGSTEVSCCAMNRM